MIEDVTPERRKRGDLERDIIAEIGGGGFPRQRAKSIITPYAARMRLMDELADKPPQYRERSVRRRLTALDRMLSDDEAYALDKAQSAWLMLNGKSKSVDALAIRGGSSQSEPLNDAELIEASEFRIMHAFLGVSMRIGLRRLFEALAPWNDEPYRFDLSQIVILAKAIKKAYRTKIELA